MIPYIVFFIALAVYLTLAGVSFFHVHRFRTEWDITKKITYVFIVFSVITIGLSFYFMFTTPWDRIL